MEYIYGKNVVSAYLDSERTPKKVWLQEGSDHKDIIGLCKRYNIPFSQTSKRDLDKLVKGVHQGVVAEIDGFQYFNTEDIMFGSHNLIVVLDGLEDPHNLGAILRTSDAVGVDGIVIGKHRSVSLNATVAKVSTGAINTVKVVEVTNISKTLKEFKDNGYWIIGVENGIDAVDYTMFPVDRPIVVVMGSEGKGISRLVLKECDILTTIPMHGSVNSLNVSVATALILYEVNRRRNQ